MTSPIRPAKPGLPLPSISQVPTGGLAAVAHYRASSDPVVAGPLTPLLRDPQVTDLLVNGLHVWADRGRGLVRVPLDLGSLADVRRLAQRLVAAAGRRLDDGCPYADVRLSDGTRLHAVLPPVAVHGPYLSLRTFRHRAFTLDELVQAGTIEESGAALLAEIVEARLAFLICGGAGTGKTTLLNTMLGLASPADRIVVVEDAAELRPPHPHVVSLQARTTNVEGTGEVGLRDLVRQALRMRPDRLVIGECRGAEVLDLLAALNTGHEGGAGTLHANSAADVPARLEALGLLGGVAPDAIRALMVAALQVVVHLRRGGSGRIVEQICVLAHGNRGESLEVVTAWHHRTGPGPASAELGLLLSGRQPVVVR